MVSTRVKGNRYERKAQKELEARGWLVQRAPPSTRFNKQVDLFGIWDILALNKYSNLQFRSWIQIKTNKFPDKEWFKKAKRFKKMYCDERDECVVWIFWERGKRKKKQGWEIIII